MITRKMTISVGPEAEQRPAAMFVQVASQYESSIHVTTGTKKINAKSIMGVMTLTFQKGEELEISANGNDEEVALDGIERFLCSTGA
ncbi:Catabolite repression HPr-like protein Crh [Lachnospiraceae bacterium TWA4]|nr:Catabolite repression HPr-like protein Crh [Lachnospiraceae bacterium TWA4]